MSRGGETQNTLARVRAGTLCNADVPQGGGRVDGGEGVGGSGDCCMRVKSKRVEVSLSVDGFMTDDHLRPDGHGNECGEHQAPMQVGG